MELSTIGNILGGEKTLKKKIEGQMDLIALGREGVTKGALMHLSEYLRLSIHQMAAMLPITERTIQRYNRTRHFNRVVSEQILKIAVVAARGIEVFGDRDRFLDWINQPNTAIGNAKPVDMLGSFFGVDIILNELTRIEHGVYS